MRLAASTQPRLPSQRLRPHRVPTPTCLYARLESARGYRRYTMVSYPDHHERDPRNSRLPFNSSSSSTQRTPSVASSSRASLSTVRRYRHGRSHHGGSGGGAAVQNEFPIFGMSGDVEIILKSQDGQREVIFQAAPTHHERNRETVRPGTEDFYADMVMADIGESDWELDLDLDGDLKE